MYDYVLVSEPLTPDQRASIGWARRQGLSDSEQPVPLLPADRRRPDPVGRLRRRSTTRATAVGPEYDRRPATFDKLEAQFRAGLPAARRTSRFPYRWGGAIDTTTRFTVTFGETHGRAGVTYALGYTGLGVGREPLGGRRRPRLAAAPRRGPAAAPAACGRAPFPIPPEPLRSLAVELIRRELDRADANEGRRGARCPRGRCDALGIGFDS